VGFYTTKERRVLAGMGQRASTIREDMAGLSALLAKMLAAVQALASGLQGTGEGEKARRGEPGRKDLPKTPPANPFTADHACKSIEARRSWVQELTKGVPSGRRGG